ncbi:flagellar biosynthesis regulator FlaF [Sphingobium sp. H39-3-25]|uniref:flagellar biosynthesis regulator FlaF n=1 Tax=Sphingobium arseniciresistens TaxID=3030834 RepID=UPI0023B9E505|nr:flagellar biosynthesis regulator FlaF [Sphingobium arseniciresistens]
MSINAYRRAQSIAETPRSTEYRLMSQITGEMIAARDAGLAGAALMPSLHRNRLAWSTFSSLCGSPGNQLPNDLRARIISIALWVERHTSAVVTGRDSIDDLIEVNRAIIEGLSNENIGVGPKTFAAHPA